MSDHDTCTTNAPRRMPLTGHFFRPSHAVALPFSFLCTEKFEPVACRQSPEYQRLHSGLPLSFLRLNDKCIGRALCGALALLKRAPRLADVCWSFLRRTAMPNHDQIFLDAKERLLRLREVRARTGLSTTTIYVRMKQGEFPRSVDIGGTRVAWRETQVDAWIQARIDASAETEA
ncbi:helix-turn-helix transcriptional regulator [Paraburkholderia sp. EG287B]|uniref:helix-turn-helix transcriptional regulator n=1 Tax=Paraburkholderia sp. EG287B TaxID=3237010 RepID=UPI0034D1888E